MHQDFLWCQVGYEASEEAGEGHRTTADFAECTRVLLKGCNMVCTTAHSHFSTKFPARYEGGMNGLEQGDPSQRASWCEVLLSPGPALCMAHTTLQGENPLESQEGPIDFC